jgi:23S rRNA C2498 (ribose-2'-O)-methylase RlmM
VTSPEPSSSNSSSSPTSTWAPLPSSEFFFCLCQQGVEKVLREELATLGFKPSYSSKGFVTAKAPVPLVVGELPRPVLSRRTCLSLGKDLDVRAVADRHGARVQYEDKGADAHAGDVVVNAVERGGSVFVGAHLQRKGLSPAPGGDPRLTVPETAPSRAWLKLEEAARLWPLPLDEGDVVVEVGCAPGGVSRALLDRGAVVVGVDPNAMDPAILASPRFTHLRCAAQQATDLPRALTGPPRMLVVDINQRPHAAISGVERVIAHCREHLRAALFTLKLGDWSHFKELPRWRLRLEQELGMTTTATQLPSNRQELCVFCAR